MTAATIAAQWLAKADNDLKNADHTLKMGEDCPYDTVCFHAQQAVEKCIKALLTRHSIPFPKSHDVGELKTLLPSNITLPLSLDEQEILSDYAIAGRYPGEIEPIGRQEAREALKIAKRVRDSIGNLLRTAP